MLQTTISAQSFAHPPPFSTRPMSQSHPNASSSSYFQSILNAALEVYEEKTKSKLLVHPIAAQLQFCDSPTAILSVLQDLVHQFDRRRRRDQKLTNWLYPTVNVLHAFSSAIGPAVGYVFSPAIPVFSGIGVLLLAAKDVDASQDVLIDIFVRIESFFKRLELYTKVPPTTAMTDVIVKILIEVLRILAIATEDIKEGRSKKIVNNLLGRNLIEDSLRKLDTLTAEVTRMDIVEIWKVAHSVDVTVNRVDDKVGNIDVKLTELIDGVKESNAGIQRFANTADEEKQSQLREALQQWLSPPDPSTNHYIACKTHHKGTASWFFQGSTIEQWKSSSSLLWIHGKAGSGKSVLCSRIIEDIMAQRKAVPAIMAYFYCDFRDEDKHNRRNLVLSIISQLCDQSKFCCEILSRVYSNHDKGARKPSDETLTKCLTEMVSHPVQGPIYIIVDALDECPNNCGMPSSQEDVLDLVEHLVSLGLPNLHICVTSRPEIDIQTTLHPLATLCVSLHDQSGQKQDIVDYVSSVVYSDKKMRRWREEDRKLVIKTLSERADGMFRWVFCQLEALRYCLPSTVRRSLEELPKTLDETYERVLMDINKANREAARRLLQCLTVALRPLRVEELAEVLTVDFDAPAYGGIPQLNPNWRCTDRQQAVAAVLSTCSSLITIVDDGYSTVVQFSHFTVKEFLTSNRLACLSQGVSYYHIGLEPAHTILAQACLSVLLHLDDHINKDNICDTPLAEYAAQYWIDHARSEDVASRMRDAMEYFLDADKPHWTAWSRVQIIDEFWESFIPDDTVEDAFPLYYASLGGFYDLAEHLVGKNPEHINARGGLMATPLVAALSRKHFRVAELLHRHGADVDVRDRRGDTVLREACMVGDLGIMKWLLDHGADVNAQGYLGWAPLHSAANYGHLQAFQMLIKYKADIHIRTDNGKSPLHVAASPRVKRDHVDIMKILLARGADPNARDKSNSSPLHYSSWSRKGTSIRRQGTVEGTRLLLKYHAIVGVEDNKGRTPLKLAMEHGCHGIEACLKEHGATVDQVK